MTRTTSSRRGSSPPLARSLRVLTLAAVALALVLGCGGDPAAPGAAAGCPSGSIAWTDGSCMPVGIQGCADIFLDEDGLCRPRMEKCPAGTIPKFDEGCVPVGIELCAEVFMEADGLCHPTMEKCPEGTFAVPQEGCLPIDGPEGCGSGTWGNIQEDPNMETIWVDPSVMTSGNGSKASPVKTITQALALVPVGGRVALGTGTYDEPIYITKAMTIEGRCPSMVRVQGTAPVDNDTSIVWVDAADDVTLRRLEIGGDGMGILATGAAGLKIEGVHVRSATTFGLVLQLTDVSITRSWIDNTLADHNGLLGVGVEATNGARATLIESAIDGNRGVGVFAIHAGTDVTVRDSIIEGTLPLASDGQFGRGADVENGARLALFDSALVRNHEVGVFAVHDGTNVSLTKSLVEDTRPSGANAQMGDGLAVVDDAELTIVGTAILRNHRVGLVVQDTAAGAAVSGSLIKGTLPQESDLTGGVGVASFRSKLRLSDSVIIANHINGLEAAGSGAEVAVTGALFERQGNKGIHADDGAEVIIDTSAFVENREAGLSVFDPDTIVTTGGSLIEETSSYDDGDGVGVGVFDGAHATLEANAITHNRLSGIYVQDAGTEVTAIGNLIADTLPRESDGAFGLGVLVQYGATLVLDENAIFKNRATGIQALDDGTALIARRNTIEGTSPQESDERFGRGIDVEFGAHVTLEANTIVANRDIGLYVGGSFVIATQNLIGGTLPQESNGHLGIGAWAEGGATLQLASSILHSNHVSALVAVDAGTTAVVSQSLIDVTQPGSFMLLKSQGIIDNVGDGLLATYGSTLDLADTRIQGCARAGVVFDDSTGTLSGVVSTGNQFGLVLQGERRPSYETGNNQFTGNTAQDIVTGGDLPVPDAPPAVPPPP